MKFNALFKRKVREPDTLNLAGGEAHAISAKLELATIFLTAFLEDQFYRKADQTVARIRELIAAIPDKSFVAKAAIHARHEAGLRSVSHLAAVELGRQVKGAAWTKRFFDRIVRRPDDVTEILACQLAFYGKPIPNALKKGLGNALARFDAHQIAKYRREQAALKLVDAVNLLHPPHSEALAGLVRGTLAPAETWETRLTRAGQESTSAEDKAIRKAEAWTALVRTRKIGYFALLRNLRNLLEQAPDLIDDAVAILTDRTAIRRSLVMPFRTASGNGRVSSPSTSPVTGASSSRKRESTPSRASGTRPSRPCVSSRAIAPPSSGRSSASNSERLVRNPHQLLNPGPDRRPSRSVHFTFPPFTFHLSPRLRRSPS